MDMEMEIDTPKVKPQTKDDDLFKVVESGDALTFKFLFREQFSKALSLRNEDEWSLLHVAATSCQAKVSTTRKFCSSPLGCSKL